jgi:hypothetical protein
MGLLYVCMLVLIAWACVVVLAALGLYQRFAHYWLQAKVARRRQASQPLVCHARRVRSDRQGSRALPALNAKAQDNSLREQV